MFSGLRRPRRAPIPALAIGNLLEVNGVRIGIGQVLRVGNDGGNHEPGVIVGLGKCVVVLLDRGLLAVGRSVLPQVPRL